MGEDPKDILAALGSSPKSQPLHLLVEALQQERQRHGQADTHAMLAAGGGAAILAAAITGGLLLWRCTRVLIPIGDGSELVEMLGKYQDVDAIDQQPVE